MLLSSERLIGVFLQGNMHGKNTMDIVSILCLSYFCDKWIIFERLPHLFEKLALREVHLCHPCCFNTVPSSSIDVCFIAEASEGSPTPEVTEEQNTPRKLYVIQIWRLLCPYRSCLLTRRRQRPRIRGVGRDRQLKPKIQLESRCANPFNSQKMWKRCAEHGWRIIQSTCVYQRKNTMITTTTLHCQHPTTPALHMQTVPLSAKYATNLLVVLAAFGSTESFEDRRCIATGKMFVLHRRHSIMLQIVRVRFLYGMQWWTAISSIGMDGKHWCRYWRDYPDIGSGSSSDSTPWNHVRTTYLQQRNTQNAHQRVPNSSMHSIVLGIQVPKSYSDDKPKVATHTCIWCTEHHARVGWKWSFGCCVHCLRWLPNIQIWRLHPPIWSNAWRPAVEMIDYGTEDGKDYWLIKNSWNNEWGDGGYFKIARGNDECGIEDDVTGIEF